MELVHSTAKNLEQLSSKLIACAREVGGAHQGEGEGEPPQVTMENTEILRRDWASQVSDTEFSTAGYIVSQLSGNVTPLRERYPKWPKLPTYKLLIGH